MNQSRPTASSDSVPVPPAQQRRPGQAGPLIMLAFWVGILTIIGLGSETSSAPDAASRETRLLLEATMQVRSAYWALRRSGAAYGQLEPFTSRDAVRTMEQLARETNSADSWRRLALTRYMLATGDWRAALLALRTAAPPRPLTEVDRELAHWRTALERPAATLPHHGGRQQDEVVAEARAFIERLELGWYRHAALAALYDHYGMPREAARHRDLALGSFDRLAVAVILLLLVVLGGAGIWCTAILAWIALGRKALASRIARFDPLPPDAARSLMLAGAAYFAGLVLLRMLPGMLPPQALQRLANDSTLRALITAGAVALSLVAPMALLRVTGFVRDVGYGAIGLVRLRPFRDLAAGLFGHASVLPALVITLVVSSMLFEPSASRVNPAIEEFTSGVSGSARLILFLAAAVLAPIVEETAFRGILLRGLQAQIGTVPAILVSSAVFAILHPQLPMGFLSIFALGVGFAVLYRITGSLWPSIVAHAINNSIVFFFIALTLAD